MCILSVTRRTWFQRKHDGEPLHTPLPHYHLQPMRYSPGENKTENKEYMRMKSVEKCWKVNKGVSHTIFMMSIQYIKWIPWMHLERSFEQWHQGFEGHGMPVIEC